ncbi:MAG: hypothetical protein OEW39_08495 [Deltaproteobacteria bacterium]|nr:hypothetical protein [Deltaproteobacteria bacterium]
MKSYPIGCGILSAIGLGLVVGWGVPWAPTPARAQTPFINQARTTVGQTQDTRGVAVWYDWSRIRLDAPADNDTPEVKGYGQAIPSSHSGNGPSIGISFSSWGLNVGFTNADADLNGRKADVKQTPADLTDDVTLYAMRYRNISINVLYSPTRWFYLGMGKDMGNIEFVQQNAMGNIETRKLPMEGQFYSLGFAFGFDPTVRSAAPLIAAFTKIPAKRGHFSSFKYGVGLGVFF